jgi:hypothetical protein
MHGVTTQKTAIFILAAVRTSNSTFVDLGYNAESWVAYIGNSVIFYEKKKKKCVALFNFS